MAENAAGSTDGAVNSRCCQYINQGRSIGSQYTPEMNPLGLLPLVQTWVPEHAALKLGIALPGIVLLCLLYSYARPDEEHQVATPLPLSGVSTIRPFFRARFDFLRQGFYLTGQPIFQFNLLQARHSLLFHIYLRLILAAIEHCHRGLGRIWQSGFFVK